MKSKAAIGALVLLVALVLGQVLAWLLNAEGYAVFMQTLPIVLSQIAFWGPIIALIAGGFMLITLRLLGFRSLDEIRAESIEQNNPTPAIVFVGTLIASMLFLSLVIRP
jgi:predicted lysophospholipase L1 biosynthesis ABC-type transport system permease subunit